MTTHRRKQARPRSPNVLLRAHQFGKRQGDVSQCVACGHFVSLHFEKHDTVRRMVGCDGAAIAARISARRTDHDGASA